MPYSNTHAGMLMKMIHLKLHSLLLRRNLNQLSSTDPVRLGWKKLLERLSNMGKEINRCTTMSKMVMMKLTSISATEMTIGSNLHITEAMDRVLKRMGKISVFVIHFTYHKEFRAAST